MNHSVHVFAIPVTHSFLLYAPFQRVAAPVNRAALALLRAEVITGAACRSSCNALLVDAVRQYRRPPIVAYGKKIDAVSHKHLPAPTL